MVERLLGIILPVFMVIALGYVYARRARPDMTWVNRINMNVLAPALIFSALASKDFDLYANRGVILGAIGVVVGSGLLAWPFARLLHEDVRTFVPPMMFNNCGNMGLPLAVLAFGQPGLSAMVAIFTISNLLHFTVGVHIINRHAAFWPVFRNPMVIATFVGFAFAILHPPIPDWLMLAIKMTGDANDSADAHLAWRAHGDGKLGRMELRDNWSAGLFAYRHRHGGAARTRARPQSGSAGAPDSVRLLAACSAQLHGRRAI